MWLVLDYIICTQRWILTGSLEMDSTRIKLMRSSKRARRSEKTAEVTPNQYRHARGSAMSHLSVAVCFVLCCLAS